MQAIDRFPLQPALTAAAMLCKPLPSMTLRENQLRARGEDGAGSVFQLIVRCAPSQVRVGPLLQEALTEHLLCLHQRFTITASGRPLCIFQAIARGGRASCRRVVALMDKLEQEEVRDVRWESVVQPPATVRRPKQKIILK
jgi:hypothetical protein